MAESEWTEVENFENDWVPIDEKPKSVSNAAEAGLMHGLQGVSWGLLDEASGAVEAAGRMAGIKGAGGSFSDLAVDDDGPTLDWETLRDAYRQARDKKHGVLKKQKEESPIASNVGEFAGAVLSPLNKVMGGGGAVIDGALMGAGMGFGNSEAETAGGLVTDTVMGGVLGGGIGKVADMATPYIQKGVQSAGEGLKSGANRMAARALGAERGTIKKLGADKVDGLGRYALDEKILSPLASTDDMIARNAAKADKGGKLMDDVYSQIDDAGASTFNPQQAATEVDAQLGGFYRSPINAGETRQFENTLESILMRGEGNIPLREAQLLKQELGKVANWKNNLQITDKERMARDAYGIVSKQIDDATEAGAQAIGSDGLLSTLKQGKQLYGNSKGAGELLANKQAREEGNKLLGLTDWSVLGAGGAAAPITAGASVVPTLAFVGAKKGLEKFGAQNAALGMDKISKALLKSPQMANLYQKNPAAFQALASKFEKNIFSGGEQAFPRAADEQSQNFNETSDKDAMIQKFQGTKYAQVLQNAAQKGDQSFAAAHYVLRNRDNVYRKHLEEK